MFNIFGPMKITINVLQGQTLLHYAAEEGLGDMVRLLVSFGGDPNAVHDEVGYDLMCF